jgi:hypothetical protein
MDLGILLDHLNLPYRFPATALPIRPRPAVVVRMISIACYQRLGGSKRDLQEKLDAETRAYALNAFCENNVGTENFRKINLHGTNYFSVEQQITFLPIHADNGT